ncbi:MAG: serine/threonine protein kinase [Acidobacteriota bacterium]
MAADADNDATDLFLSLTPDRVLEAVEASGLRCRPVCYPLNSFENRVYEVELEDHSRVVAKFYRPQRWGAEQILAEHEFLAELAAEDIPVCTMRPFPDGTTLQRIDRIYYCLSNRRGGRAPDELSDAAIERLGMFIGRMHNVAARRAAPSRPRLDADHYVRRELAWMELDGTLGAAMKRRYFAAAEQLADLADELMAGVETHRIHADLHLGNILFRDGELRVMDFDDFAEGPAVQDLWLALPGRGRECERQRELLLAGYERFRRFERSTLRLIETLRGLRLVRYAGWLARRYHDPAFQAGWPHFGSDEFWEQETVDLEEQLATARAEAGQATPPASGASSPPIAVDEGEELLSNKDYFWDWEGD